MEKAKRILGIKEIILYGLGIMGYQLFIGYVNTYQSQFYTSVFGANLMIIAGIILGAKLLSALIDPIIGNLIDGSHFKQGKMKPFIFISSFPIAIITTVMFIAIDFHSKAGMYVYITLITIIWNIAMSFADIPSQGLLALLSPEPSERNTAANFSNIFRSIALGAPGVIVPLVCILTSSGAVTKKEYLITAFAILVLGFIPHLLMSLFTKERVVAKEKEKASFKQMFGELKSNKMIMIMFLTFILGFARNIGLGIGVQSAAVLLKDGLTVNIGSFHYSANGENLPWLIGFTSGIATFIGLFTVPAINKRWGEKKTFIVFAIYGGITSLTAFTMYVLGGEALRSIWAILVYQFICGLMYGPHGYLPLVMTGDIVDYQEWKTGKRTEGVQFAIYSMAIKLSNALSVAVGIFIVGASGYVGTMTSADITDKMQNIMCFAYLAMPGIATLLSMIPMFWYKIDASAKEKMRDALAKKREIIEEVAVAENED